MRQSDVLILAGSLREHSVSYVAGEILQRSLLAAGISTSVLAVGDLRLPFFNPDIHRPGCGVADAYLDSVRAARALIWCAPSYHRTIAGSFKNAIDFLELLSADQPIYLTGKVVGAVATSKGIVAAANTAAELAMTAQALRAFAFPLQVPITASHKILDDAGNLLDKRIVGKLELLAHEVKVYLLGSGVSSELRSVG
jgi:NAD(P)H-dependent FMN reductase